MRITIYLSAFPRHKLHHTTTKSYFHLYTYQFYLYRTHTRLELVTAYSDSTLSHLHYTSRKSKTTMARLGRVAAVLIPWLLTIASLAWLSTVIISSIYTKHKSGNSLYFVRVSSLVQ